MRKTTVQLALKSLSVFITAVMLFTVVAQPVALAARPLASGLLADQAVGWPDQGIPQGPQAPQDPFQAALAGLPQGQTGANPQAPWPADPPKPRDFQDTVRASVDAESGTLSLSGSEFEAPFFDLPFGFSLTYSSADAGRAGTAGYGWSTSADQYLRMYVDFNISEFRGDGSHVGFLFKPADPNQFVDSYDGDNHIYYNLDQGHYEAQSATNTSTLTRLSATDYLVRHQDGTELRYAGYTAPWHTPQSKTAGKLTKITDPHGNSLTFSYNSDGLLTTVADSAGRKIKLSYENGLLTSVTDPAGGVYHYAYVYIGSKG